MRLSQIVFPKFEKFPHLRATLHFYLNFVKSPQGKTGYYYRALFSCRNKNSGKSFLLIEHIPVELLPLIPSGHTYLFDSGKIVGKQFMPSLRSTKINLIIPKNQEIKRLSEYISPEKFHKFGFLSKEGQYISFKREISSQYVVKIKHKGLTFLIPSTLIASFFYFFSSRVIPYVLRNALEDTHKGISVDGGVYRIVMSRHFSKYYASKIVFFLTDTYAKKSLIEFSGKNLKKFLTGELKFPIYARFPFSGTYPCKVYYEVIENYAYVHFLKFTKKSLPYNKLSVEVIRIKTEQSKGIETEVKNSIPIEVPEEPEGAEYRLSRVRPSKYLKTYGLRTALEGYQTNVKEGVLLSESAVKVRCKFFKTRETVETVSVEDKAKPYTETERKTAKLEVICEGPVSETDYEIGLEKFRELLQTLKDKFKFKIIFEKELWVPIRRKNRDRVSQIEYYDWEKVYEGKKPTRRRKFLLVMGRFPDINNLVGEAYSKNCVNIYNTASIS